jgi:hypothetical protein
MCRLEEIGRKELQCASDTADENDSDEFITVGFSCTGLVTYNATCLDANVTHFNCSYVYCSVQDKYSPALSCHCSLPDMVKTVGASFGPVFTSIALDFCATFRSTDELSGKDMWETVATLVVGLGFFALVLHAADRVDKSAALQVANQAQAEERREREEVAAATDTEARMIALSSAMMRSVNTSFPAIFNKDSVSQIFLVEMKRSHRWASLLFHYNPRRPRALRLLVLASLVNCVLFLNALFFNITHYDDDHSCEQYLYQHTCISDPSRYSSEDSKCYWAEQDYQCRYKEPGSHSSATVLAMLASAIFSIPLVLVFELIVNEILLRPSASSPISSSSSSSSLLSFFSKGSIRVAPTPNENDDGEEEEDEEDDNDSSGETAPTTYDEESDLKRARHDLVDLVSA